VRHAKQISSLNGLGHDIDLISVDKHSVDLGLNKGRAMFLILSDAYKILFYIFLAVGNANSTPLD
jgi:hypothetical protein